MLDDFFDRFFALSLLAVFFLCATIYNIGYFGTLGDSFWYALYVPITIFDIIKTGFVMAIPLIFILLAFKPVLINPAFKNEFPGAYVLLFVAAMVMVSNLLYFTVFIDSPNQTLSIISEASFYIFAIVCVIAIVYYLFTTASPQFLMIIFLVSLLPISLIVGIVDAKIAINSNSKNAKSQILLKNDIVINANILRSFDKGMFVIISNASSFHFVSWDEIKEVKFKKVSGF